MPGKHRTIRNRFDFPHLIIVEISTIIRRLRIFTHGGYRNIVIPTVVL